MRKLIYIVLSCLIFACDSKDASDCFQTSGSIIQKTVEVVNFEKILVNRDVELILKEGNNYAVIVETGENLINDVDVVVVNNELQLTDNNNCNYVRDYGITKVYVTAPNIKEIRSSTQFDISSDGVLSYDRLKLLSEDFNAPGSFTVGDFRLHIEIDDFEVVSNNISSFYIVGETENLKVGFFSGTGRFEGVSLVAQHVKIEHRASNDIIVNPQQSIEGELKGTGNVIAVNEPPIIDVQELYTGQLIFN
jgi:hypothetical protein